MSSSIKITTLAFLLATSFGCGLDEEDPVDPAMVVANNGETNNSTNGGETNSNNVATNSDPNTNNSSNGEPNSNNVATNGDPNTNNSNSEPGTGTPVPGWVGGTTVDGRPMIVEHYGDSGPVLFLLSAIHGTERLSVTYGERFRTELAAGFAERHGVQVVFLQSANPDGVSRYERYNTNNIDLNRNFDTANFAPGGTGGDVPLSEPEAVALKGMVDASGLSAAISLHCCAPIMDHDGPALELATSMSNAMDEPYRFPEGKLGASPGSLGSYVGLDLGLPIITVEFARTDQLPALPQLEQMNFAMEAAGEWVQQNPAGGTLRFDAFPQLDDHDYESWFAGASETGLPLRSERIGPTESQDVTNVLLSGFDGDHRRGTWIAEHTRRELLAFPSMIDQTWLVHTAVNPDAIADGSIDPNPVRDAIAAGDDSVTEAAAVLELLAEPSRVFLVENATGNNDCAEVYGPDSAMLEDQIPDSLRCTSTQDSLAAALASQGHTVVRLSVDTETAEAQLSGSGTNTTFDTSIPSPLDYSDFILEFAGLQ